MDNRVSVLDAFIAYDPNFNTQKFLKYLVLALELCCVICACLLVQNTDGWNLNKLFSFHLNDGDFYNKTLDCFWVAISQCVFLTLVAALAIRDANEATLNNSIESDSSILGYCNCLKCINISKKSFSRLSFESQCDSEGNQPLLSGAIKEEFKSEIEGYEDEINRKREDNRSIDESNLAARKVLENRKSLWLAVLFVISSVSQVYVGLKCISFNYTNQERDGALMGLNVLWVNLISWLLKEIVMLSTKEEGELIPSLHPHKLHLHTSLAAHWCDLCGQQCTEGRAFRCKLCDFDLCVICYAKRNKFTLEGQLRGDKGVRQETQLTGDKYFMRALSLIRGEWFIFSMAMMCLCINNGINLMMPKIQGSILNAVVQDKHSTFTYWVEIYLIAAVATGFFGGCQSLCFNVVGRKLTNTIRKKLFQGIIVQDIAFFDGNSSGQLTSRLTNDVGFMVSPIQSMLGTLISNTILLLGGIVLCFLTSWRLSILAFTTIGPIVHVTQIYAKWSQGLNRRIYAALGAANGYATEALANVRTVKAFTSEHLEQDRYDEAINNALEKGIKDAFGGAGMYAINSYLELGAAVLILWYGGKMAMDDKHGMSPGRLITYQLYWNMLNSAYKNLLDIVTSFTRAAGAAQRVFDLMDSLPDIDIDAGFPVLESKLVGEIELQSVSFAYQMRPTSLVLNGIDLIIKPGTTCALVGKSGGGKSTLVNMLMRFYDPKGGRILLDGQDLRELCMRDVRKQIGVVAQNTELFGGTIEDNITYGLELGTWTRKDVIQAAKNACAHDFIKEFPEGYLTRVGERGVRISGGQKQRIAIARVFLHNPRILLLDEATSALDAESESKVQEALDKLMTDKSKQRTIVLVAHRLSTVMNADQIAVVNGGQIVERGTHEELIGMNGVYANLVRKQLEKKNSIVDADAVESQSVNANFDEQDNIDKQEEDIQNDEHT